MGTAILMTVTNAAQNINASLVTVGTYTNSTNYVQNVMVWVYVLAPGSTDASATYTIRLTRSGLTTYLRNYDAVGAESSIGRLVGPINTFDGGTDSSFQQVQVRPGETLTVGVQSNSASDTSVAVTVTFVDADAVIAKIVTGSVTGVSLASAGYQINSTVEDYDRVIYPRADLSNFGGSGANNFLLDLNVQEDASGDSVLAFSSSYGDNPDTQTTYIADSGSIPLLKAAGILVPAGHYLQMVLKGSGSSVTSVNVTYYFDEMETPRSGSGAPFIFIDDDQ